MIQVKSTQYTDDFLSTLKIKVTQWQNLPPELANQIRFAASIIASNGDKKPIKNRGINYAQPKNYSTAEDAVKIAQALGGNGTAFAALDICGYGKLANYVMFDFDNVLDAQTGEFINDEARRWFNCIQGGLEGCYAEVSASGKGIHIIAEPTQGKFPKITNKDDGVLWFDRDKNCKLEVFHNPEKRKTCHMTGAIFEGSERRLAKGEDVDLVVQQILDEIQKSLPEKEKKILRERKELPADIRKLVDDVNNITYEELMDKGVLKHSENGAAAPEGFICPQCGSGTHEHKTGALKFYTEEDNNHVHCHARGDCHEDIVSLLARHYGKETTGKDFLDVLKQAAADFKINYDPKIFERAARAGWPGIDEVFADDADLAQRLKDWQEINGTIAPALLTSIHDAVAFLKGLSVDNITADIANSSRLKEAVALCQFYETGGAQEAVAKVKLAKERAIAAIRAPKKAGGEFVAEPDIALVALALFNIEDWQRAVRTLFNTHRKAHKSFQKYEEQRKAREKAQEKREAQLMKMENARERLSKLKALPKTPERDTAIIETIKELCSWRLDSHDNPIKIEATQANIDLIFVNDPNLDGLFAYDEFITADVFMKSSPWEEKQAGEEWKPADDARLQTYLQRTYTEFHDEKLIKRNFTDYSQARKFHVIRDYFNNLPAWDGVKRAETFFIDWLKVDDTPFAREVTLNWLTAAIARIFKPGCRYRYVLTLVGEQNIGKDFCFQRLGVKWHSSISDSLDDPHSLDALIISWLAVFEEMNAANKASVNAVKSFTSRNEDTRRESYAPRATRRPRQSVYAITTNDDKFLSDLTGNTRFLILRCNVPESEPIKEVRGERLTDDNVIAQIWAEVFAHYKEMFPQGINEHNEAKLSLSVEATKAAADVTKLYLRDDGTVEKVKTFVDKKILPPVIWDLLNREQRRKFFVEQSFTIETGVLKALFKQRRVTAQRQADFDAATAKGAFVRHIVAYDKGTRVDTTYYQFFGTVYRQHICAAEVIEEAFDRTDKRKQPAKIHEIVKRLDGWHLGKRIARDPQYGNQPVVYYRDADNIPADIDDEAATVESSETRADKSAATADNVTGNGNGMNLIAAGYNETQATTPDAQPVDEWQGEPVDDDDLPFD